MKAKLSKTGNEYILRSETMKPLAISNGGKERHKLSKQNCDEIFGVVNVEKLAEEYIKDGVIVPSEKSTFIFAFLNGMELNKDKVFTLEQMSVAYNTNRSGTLFEQLINSFGGQPTEIEVTFNPDEKDSERCLILKRVV
jgi:hypothetical protein